MQRSLSELEQLLSGLGVSVVEKVVQKRAVRSAPAYLGEGKLRDLASLTGGPGEVARGPTTARSPGDEVSDVIVVADDGLSPGQLRNLRSALGVLVLDRTDVILRVFESRARTREARLEVELARLEYELPRIRDDHTLGDREGGGGRASRGHTNVELAKQRARERIAAVRAEIATLGAMADRRRLSRVGALSVALVGYTNAGKSSLMQRLTASDVRVADALFVTVGTTVRQLSPPTVPPVVVADTVGFINRLPHELIASFRSTLSEAKEASLLLHVADASDPDVRAQIAVTKEVLSEIGAADTPRMLLLNKADRLSSDERAAISHELPDGLLTNALDQGDCHSVRSRIEAFFTAQLVERTLVVPYEQQGMLAELRDEMQVISEDYGERLVVTVRATAETLARLAAKLARK